MLVFFFQGGFSMGAHRDPDPTENEPMKFFYPDEPESSRRQMARGRARGPEVPHRMHTRLVHVLDIRRLFGAYRSQSLGAKRAFGRIQEAAEATQDLPEFR